MEITEAIRLKDVFMGKKKVGQDELTAGIQIAMELDGEREQQKELTRRIRDESEKLLKETGDYQYYKIHNQALLIDSRYEFDAFMLYIESERKPEERFYLPRRKQLKRVVDALQKMEDGELDELFLSMPGRVGKTTVVMFFLLWVMGRDTERSNLYSAYSSMIIDAMYNGLLEIINDPTTYKYTDVFPSVHLVSTDGKDTKFNFNRKKRYPTFTGRSLYGTLNGACDCNGYLIADDLLSGIEEALSPDRLATAWGKVDNNLLTRKKEHAKVIFIGTRWAMQDPIGIRQDLLMNDPKYKDLRFEVIDLPALDENDESNFDYDYGVGFSTKYYHQRRASFERNNDMASWLAQYQCTPIERSGALFEPDGMRYYNGVLPDVEPDRVFMVVDPAWGGGDYVAAPVCFQYGDDIYVHDVVFNNGDKKITIPLLANKIKEHKVAACRVEATKMTEGYKDELNQKLKEMSIRINLTSKPAPRTVGGKNQRIFDKAPEIRDNMVFRESGTRSKEYEMFMQNVFGFKMLGKNKNDDAPDSLAMGIDMAFSSLAKIKIMQRFI